MPSQAPKTQTKLSFSRVTPSELAEQQKREDEKDRRYRASVKSHKDEARAKQDEKIKTDARMRQQRWRDQKWEKRGQQEAEEHDARQRRDVQVPVSDSEDEDILVVRQLLCI